MMIVSSTSQDSSTPNTCSSSSSPTPSRSIPIHASMKKASQSLALKRSASELRLLEEEQQADLRDYIFFSRLVQGISNREVTTSGDDDGDLLSLEYQDQQDSQERKRRMDALPLFSSFPPIPIPSEDLRPKAQPHHDSHPHHGRRCSPWLQRQNDLCLAHIIGTRNGYRDYDGDYCNNDMEKRASLLLQQRRPFTSCFRSHTHPDDLVLDKNDSYHNNSASAYYSTSSNDQDGLQSSQPQSSPHEDIFGMDL